MEGAANVKKMARSKRASSQRLRTKHSRLAHGGAPTVARETGGIAEESLPSNWERYGDASGSDDDDGAPLREGEVRPKSKGADYSQLLSSELPRLYEEPPEPAGMMALLLSNGLGLWDWDSSYLEPVSSTSERQAAREASALLTVDLSLLGKNLALLSAAQRLFLEDELFPKQERVKDRVEMIGTTMRISDSSAAVDNHGVVHEHADPSWGSRVSSGNELLSAGFPSFASSSDATVSNKPETASTVSTDLSRLSTKTLSVEMGDTVTSSSGTVKGIHAPTIHVKEEMRMESPRVPYELKKFEAGAAEAELDDLLNMLDSQAACSSSNKVSQDNLSGSSPPSKILSPSYPAPSSSSNIGPQDSWVEAGPRELTPKSEPGPAPKQTGVAASTRKTVEDGIPFQDAKGTDVPLSEGDDFDSWLDSI